MLPSSRSLPLPYFFADLIPIWGLRDLINVESSSRRPRGIMVPPKLEFLMMDFAIPSDSSHPIARSLAAEIVKRRLITANGHLWCFVPLRRVTCRCRSFKGRLLQRRVQSRGSPSFHEQRWYMDSTALYLLPQFSLRLRSDGHPKLACYCSPYAPTHPSIHPPSG